MYGKLIYKLPEDISKIVKAIKTLPSDWKGISGHLIAPKELYLQNLIAENTRLRVCEEYPAGFCIVGSDDVPFEKEYDKRYRNKEAIIPKFIDIFAFFTR